MGISSILIVVLLCIGAVQGIVYGIMLLWNKGENRIANQLLATILFFFSYRLIVQILRLFKLGYYDTWYHFMIDFNWIYGALIYFFVKAHIVPEFRLQQKDWVHFLPVFIQVICSNFVRTQNFYWDGTRESLSWLGYWGYVVWMNYPTIYIIASLLIIVYSFKAGKLLNRPAESTEILPDKIRWIHWIILSFRAYFILVVAILLVDLLVYDITFGDFYYYFERFYYYPLFIGFSLLTYWLGIIGFKQKDQPILKVKPTLSAKEKEQLQEIAHNLNRLMDTQKLYKNAELNLTTLAEQLEVKPYLLTKCLKIVYGKKFNDYVNEFRIEEVKSLLQNTQYQHYTLLGLAYEAGFNSKSSFNRAVKRHVGVSPNKLKNVVSGGLN